MDLEGGDLNELFRRRSALLEQLRGDGDLLDDSLNEDTELQADETNGSKNLEQYAFGPRDEDIGLEKEANESYLDDDLLNNSLEDGNASTSTSSST